MAEIKTGLKNEPIWYSYHHYDYSGSAPWFYDPAQFSWVLNLEENFASIKIEAERLIENSKDQLEPYLNEGLVDNEKSWSTLVFYFWGTRNHALMRKSQFFEDLFASIPGFISAAISKLEAGSEIKWHPGDTSGVIRCHFPLIVPSSLPDCGFQVMDEERSWEEGKMLMFCDAHKHRAFNHSAEDRFILIIDIVHPDYREKKREIILNARSILRMQRLFISMPFLRKTPRFVQSFLRFCCKIFIYIYNQFKREG